MGFIKRVALMMLISTFAVSGYSQNGEKEVIIADRVIAVIGDRMILQSDLLMTEAYMKEQAGIPLSENLTDDEMAMLLNNMMTQKLLAAQAELDSLEVSHGDILASVEGRVAQLLDQYGSIQAVENKFGKAMYMLRAELMDQMKEQMLAQTMTNEIRSKVTITPREVKEIIGKMDKDSLTLIPEQYEYSQILFKAPSTEETRSAVKERLLGMREEIMNGKSLAAFARMYSDHESGNVGGEMTVTPQMVYPEFADAMVSLPIGGISNIVETEEGYHLIELLSKNNDRYTIRQILLRTQFSLIDQEKASLRLDSIRTEIDDKNITFEEAASKFSEDENTKITGGKMVNSIQSDQYGAAQLKSSQFFVNELGGDYRALSGLKEGEISAPFISHDETGNVVVKMVRLDKRSKEHIADLKRDYNHLKDMALSKKTDTTFQKWLQKQKERIYVRIEKPYRDYAIIKEAWDK